MLTERKIVDRIQVERDGPMLVSFVTLVERAGVPIGEAEQHTLLLEPGADLALKLTGEPFTLDPKTVTALGGVVAAVHTPEVVTAWQKKAAETQASAFPS